MAWTIREMTKMRVNSVDYYLPPNTFVFLGEERTEVNQVRQESESGEIKVLELDSNKRRIAEFSINRMKYGTISVGSTTLIGWATLRSLIESTAMNYMEGTCELWFPNTVKSGSADGTFRFMGTSLAVPVVRKPDLTDKNTWLYGDGSQVLRFREDI